MAGKLSVADREALRRDHALPALAAHKRLKFFWRQRRAEQKALQQIAAELAERLPLGRGFDTFGHHFQAQRLSHLHDGLDDGAVVGMIGRLDPQKGFDLLADATPEILARGGRVIVQGSGRS